MCSPAPFGDLKTMQTKLDPSVRLALECNSDRLLSFYFFLYLPSSLSLFGDLKHANQAGRQARSSSWSHSVGADSFFSISLLSSFVPYRETSLAAIGHSNGRLHFYYPLFYYLTSSIAYLSLQNLRFLAFVFFLLYRFSIPINLSDVAAYIQTKLNYNKYVKLVPYKVCGIRSFTFLLSFYLLISLLFLLFSLLLSSTFMSLVVSSRSTWTHPSTLEKCLVLWLFAYLPSTRFRSTVNLSPFLLVLLSLSLSLSHLVPLLLFVFH